MAGARKVEPTPLEMMDTSKASSQKPLWIRAAHLNKFKKKNSKIIKNYPTNKLNQHKHS